MTIVLDTGALIAIDRQDRRMAGLFDAAIRRNVQLRTSGAVIAQVWRDGRRQVNLSRSLVGIEVVPLDDFAGRLVGKLLARSSTSDVVDGHVALLINDGDQLVTSDPDDLARLIAERGVTARVLKV